MGYVREVPVVELTDREPRRVLFEQFLRCIDREENLLHYRVSWGIQWNGAIFAAMVGVVALELPFERLTMVIQILLASIGALAGWLSYVGVRAAMKQSEYLINEIQARLKLESDQAWLESEFIRPFGQIATVHLPARKAAARFPLLFMSIWGAFAIYTTLRLLNSFGVIQTVLA